MNRFWLPAIALCGLTAKAQNVSFQEIPHLHTALHHLTVIDLGEPIQMIAAADPDAFQIERAGDKVLLQPLKDNASTNLILWTATRQVAYELDAPGDVAKMNVLVRNLPASVRTAANAASTKERDEIAAGVTAQAILGTQDIVAEPAAKRSSTGVSVKVERVLQTNDGTYLEYEVVNHSGASFRVVTPSVTHLQPTQIPISLLGLRNHELSPQTLDSFRTRPNGTSVSVSGQSQQRDVAPGDTTSGYVLVRRLSGSTPEMYQLDFGSTSAGSLIATVVI